MITLTDDEEEVTQFSLDGVLENASAASLEIALQWMYARDVNISVLDTSTLFELYCISNFLSLSFLKRVIELQLITTISLENVFDCIPFAETHSAQALLAACYFFVSGHYFEVVTKHKAQLEEVVSEQTLSKIKKQTRMSPQEIYMLEKFLYTDTKQKVPDVPKNYPENRSFPSNMILYGNAKYNQETNTVTIVQADHDQYGYISAQIGSLTHGFELKFTFLISDILDEKFSFEVFITDAVKPFTMGRVSMRRRGTHIWIDNDNIITPCGTFCLKNMSGLVTAHFYYLQGDELYDTFKTRSIMLGSITTETERLEKIVSEPFRQLGNYDFEGEHVVMQACNQQNFAKYEIIDWRVRELHDLEFIKNVKDGIVCKACGKSTPNSKCTNHNVTCEALFKFLMK